MSFIKNFDTLMGYADTKPKVMDVIFEADDDANQADPDFAEANAGGNDAGGGDDTGTADNTDAGGNDTATDDNGGNNENTDDNADGDDDFTIGSSEVEDDGGDEGGDTGGDDTTSTDDTEGEESEDKSINKDIREKEREIFDNLSPAEQKVKNTMMKKMFADLYASCESVADKLNQIGADLPEGNVQIKKIVAMTHDLKQMVSDYLLNLYESRSYIENDTMFNYYLSILNSIKNIIQDIVKAVKSENKELPEEDEN